jgi:hypothetical protein
MGPRTWRFVLADGELPGQHSQHQGGSKALGRLERVTSAWSSRTAMGVEPGVLRGHPLDSANRSSMAVSAGQVSFAVHLLAAAEAVGRGRRLAGCMAHTVRPLDGEGLLKWDETFLDGSFAPAKKGAQPSEEPSVARTRSGWYWSTVKVFRWEFGSKVPLREKLHLRNPR